MASRPAPSTRRPEQLPSTPTPGFGFSWLELKLALRLTRKQPVLALTSVLALAVGLAVATTGFSVIDAMLHGSLPFENGDRFVRIQVLSHPEGWNTELDLGRFQLFRDSATGLAHVGAMSRSQASVLHPSGRVDSLVAAWITPDSFGQLPYVPKLGRTLIADDGAPGAPPVVVLRESYWQRRFDADPELLGQQLEIAGTPRTVVGVLADEAEFPAGGEAWLPLDPRTLGGRDGIPRTGVRVFGVLAPGVDLAAADSEISALSRQQLLAFPPEDETRLRVTSFVEPPRQSGLMGGVMMLTMVLLLTVIASNVANLVRTRTSARGGEMAVRAALGAGRSRLVGQLTLEMAVLGLMAAVLAGTAAHYATRWLDGLMIELPFWIEIAAGPRTLAFLAALTLLVILVGGTFPALRATAGVTARRLQQASRSGTGRGLGRTGAAMMVTEMALSVALLTAALVLAQGFSSYVERDFGLPEGKVLTARLWAPQPTAESSDSALRPLPQRIADALEGLPGVRAAGVGSHLPRADAGEQRVVLDDGPSTAVAGGTPFSAPVAWVLPGYFDTLDAAPTLGRDFESLDLEPGAPAVALVNQPFVDRHLAGRNPIGRRIRWVEDDEDGAHTWYEIVGVVADLGLSSADPERAAGLYLPMTDDRRVFNLALLATGDPDELAGPLRRAVAGVDPELELLRVQPLEQVNWDERAFLSGFSKALVAMGAMTLLLSLVGLYAMISFAVTRRTREIGLRKALGAGHRQIFVTVSASALAYLAVGATLGGAMASWVVRLQDAMLVTRLPSGEPWILPTVLVLVALTGCVACWLPARRALGIEPMEALRHE